MQKTDYFKDMVNIVDVARIGLIVYALCVELTQDDTDIDDTKGA